MNEMTAAFYTTIENVMDRDKRTVVLLGVSGVGICVDLAPGFPAGLLMPVSWNRQL